VWYGFNMCDDHEHDHGAAEQSAPRPVEGEAVDPISLEPVDEVVITMLMDNSYDGLLAGGGQASRSSWYCHQSSSLPSDTPASRRA